ncbi:ankyrin repeat-containing domain protein [Xylariaceae sp. FL0594]|nr:ankyrin repeat-containing domain protein [Xylariaceae sp. FL0594]
MSRRESIHRYPRQEFTAHPRGPAVLFRTVVNYGNAISPAQRHEALEKIQDCLIFFYGDIDSTDETTGHTALSFACASQFNDVVSLLLNFRVDPLLRPIGGQASPLEWAVHHKSADMVKQLLDYVFGQAKPEEKVATSIKVAKILETAVYNDKRPGQLTPLHYAVYADRTVIFAWVLVDCKPFINVKTATGWTPLEKAVSNSNIAIVESLLRCGADVNSYDIHGKTILHLAVEQNHIKVLKMVLQKRAPKDAPMKQHPRYTPYQLACHLGKMDFAQLKTVARGE